jgi:GT2 family glycosyltransferase/glycosyltransferase involved in cell wall biosynthesis
MSRILGPLRVFKTVLRRFESRHLYIRQAGFALRIAQSQLAGYVDFVEVSEGNLRLTGWAKGNSIGLSHSGAKSTTAPSIERGDVGTSTGGRPLRVGFVIQVPVSFDSVTLTLWVGDAEYQFPVPQLELRTIVRARVRVWWQFVCAIGMELPKVFQWLLNRDSSAAASINSRLGLGSAAPQIRLKDRVFQAGDAGRARERLEPVTIVLPVYNGLSLLSEALNRIEANTDISWRLIVVEDCSSDPDVRPFVEHWCACRAHVDLIENDLNQGFVRSVNTALAKALGYGNHVILLNSDAFVPKGWAGRLLAPIATNASISSVTPMSNDAEIFSVPVAGTRIDLRPGEADQIDSTARRLRAGAAVSDAPTGVGFCMAINIAFLRSVGALDEIFGRGYGEEVDWCQRASRQGGRNVGIGNLFVEHRGGASFGMQKAQLIASHSKIIMDRYPLYSASVQDFVDNDPLATERLALAVSLFAARQAEFSIFIAHSLGGGAEKYLLNRLRQEKMAAIVIRVGGHLARWSVELYAPGIPNRQFFTDDWDAVIGLLYPINQRRIVYSNAVSDRDPYSIPSLVRGLRRSEDDQIEVLFHDYFPISPSHSLLNAAGLFRGMPLAGSEDAAHRWQAAGKREVTLSEWQEAWGALMKEAVEMVVFSESSRKLVETAFPEAASKIIVRPHNVDVIKQIPHTQRKNVVVGVLGNINRQKGAEVVIAAAKDLTDRGVGLIVIGNFDPSIPLPSAIKIHGTYELEQLPVLVARYGITDWLIPSISPETFSYTTHEALATGMPVWTFDLGAQGDAAKRASNGHVIPFDMRPHSAPDQAKALADLFVEDIVVSHNAPT